MKKFVALVALEAAVVCLSAPRAFATQAQPVPIPENPSFSPQLEVDGVGIATVGYATSPKPRAALDFSDTSLLVGAAQRLYGEGIGSMGFGWLAPELGDNSLANPLFLHQAFVDYQNQSVEWTIGRTDNPSSHLVDFPTLREENLLTFTNPLNPFSSGANPEEHRYSNSAALTWNQNLTTFENFHVQHLLDSSGQSSTPTSLNSFGATFEYLCSPGMEALARVASFGAGFEYEQLSQPVSQGLAQLYAGGVLNLNESTTDRVDLRAQELVSFGSSLSQFQSMTDTFQAAYDSVSASLRYLHTPYGQGGYQLSLTGGYRSFFGVSQAQSFGLAATAVRRLGEGFDLAAQYLTQWRDTALAAQYAGQQTENSVEVGMIFNFGATINAHLSPRRSLLNLQHQYVPD